MKVKDPIRSIRKLVWAVLLAVVGGAAVSIVYGYPIALSGSKPALFLVGLGATTAVCFLAGMWIIRPKSAVGLLAAAALAGAGGGTTLWFLTQPGIASVWFIFGGGVFVPFLFLCDSGFDIDRLEEMIGDKPGQPEEE